MNLIKVLPVLALTFINNSFAAQSANIEVKNLYGTWQCEHEVVEPNSQMTIKVNYKVNYAVNGTSSGNGDLYFTMAGVPELHYKTQNKATWSVKGDQLTMKSTDISFVNVNHPELDKFLNIKQILPASVNESGTILSLSKDKITVKSEAYSDSYTCNKAV
jgi:hypothetical protein